jgi:hypothetical protein
MLMEQKVDFISVDNPTDAKFTIHILAAVAEHERDAISARTKENSFFRASPTGRESDTLRLAGFIRPE